MGNSQLFLSLMLVAATQASPLKVSQTKAASPYVNIGCQCSPLTFVDQYGAIQGNCKSVDSSGARWCYVDSHHSSCQDLRFSARFPPTLPSPPLPIPSLSSRSILSTATQSTATQSTASLSTDPTLGLCLPIILVSLSPRRPEVQDLIP